MYRLHGYAIVSEDDRIADAQGRFPDALKNEADWAYFQAGLDRTVLTLLGRRSHDASPNAKGRLRLVMSGSVAGLERRTDAWWWNPQSVSLAAALQAVAPTGGDVGVPGGQAVFEFLGPAAFSTFHLARAHGRVIPDGRGLFRACESGVPADAVLRAGGLVPESRRWLDEPQQVSLAVWRQPQER
jgi:hypothetical protein